MKNPKTGHYDLDVATLEAPVADTTLPVIQPPTPVAGRGGPVLPAGRLDWGGCVRRAERGRQASARRRIAGPRCRSAFPMCSRMSMRRAPATET